MIYIYIYIYIWRAHGKKGICPISLFWDIWILKFEDFWDTVIKKNWNLKLFPVNIYYWGFILKIWMIGISSKCHLRFFEKKIENGHMPFFHTINKCPSKLCTVHIFFVWGIQNVLWYKNISFKLKKLNSDYFYYVKIYKN